MFDVREGMREGNVLLVEGRGVAHLIASARCGALLPRIARHCLNAPTRHIHTQGRSPRLFAIVSSSKRFGPNPTANACVRKPPTLDSNLPVGPPLPPSLHTSIQHSPNMAPTLRPRPATATANGGSSPSKASAASTPPFPTLMHEYLLATRPWTFTASLVPLLLTAVILLRHASASSDPASLPPSLPSFLSAMGALLLVHAASNLTNTYYDFVSGRDTKKVRGREREGGREKEKDWSR